MGMAMAMVMAHHAISSCRRTQPCGSVSSDMNCAVSTPLTCSCIFSRHSACSRDLLAFDESAIRASQARGFPPRAQQHRGPESLADCLGWSQALLEALFGKKVGGNIEPTVELEQIGHVHRFEVICWQGYRVAHHLQRFGHACVCRP